MECSATEMSFGVCRCCLVEGDHRDILKEYTVEGNREMYADIFIECFNLFLCSDVRLTSLICGSCIKQLKDAYSFKTQVIRLEGKMLKALSCEGNETVYVKRVPENIKEEITDAVKEEWNYADQEHDEFEDFALDDEVITEDAKLVCGEEQLLARFSGASLRALPTCADLGRLCPGYFKHLAHLRGQVIEARSLQELLRDPPYSRLSKLNSRKKTREKTKKKLFENSNSIEYSSKITTPNTEKMAHVSNIATLLENSNVTAFMTKFKNGYPCFYCKTIFEDFERLRGHQKEHAKENIQKLVLKKYRKGRPDSLVVYVDVADLKCTLCGECIASINELKSHLTKVHKKVLYTNYSDRVVPFLMSDKYLCQVCSFNFETFGAIERHMNTHYRNYVCEDCGSGFVTRHRLKIHKYNLHSIKGIYPCELCKKTFPNHRRLKIHNDFVHKATKKLQCPKCPAKFSYYYVRQKHLLDVHGETPVIYKCNVCEKEFKRRYPLSIHIKKEHLSQGDFNCELCSYTCFSSNELKVHLVKSHGESDKTLTKSKKSLQLQ